MSKLNIEAKKTEYPKWIEEVYSLLSDEDKEVIVKAEIYCSCRPSPPEIKQKWEEHVKTIGGLPEHLKDMNHDYEISEFARGMSNRVRYSTAQTAANALVICASMYPHTFLASDEVMDYVCPCCGYKFYTRQLRPSCQFCNKYSWQKKKEQDDN